LQKLVSETLNLKKYARFSSFDDFARTHGAVIIAKFCR
jgi:hypothetical protein